LPDAARPERLPSGFEPARTPCRSGGVFFWDRYHSGIFFFAQAEKPVSGDAFSDQDMGWCNTTSPSGAGVWSFTNSQRKNPARIDGRVFSYMTMSTSVGRGTADRRTELSDEPAGSRNLRARAAQELWKDNKRLAPGNRLAAPIPRYGLLGSEPASTIPRLLWKWKLEARVFNQTAPQP
jgi:hypothetical protein